MNLPRFQALGTKVAMECPKTLDIFTVEQAEQFEKELHRSLIEARNFQQLRPSPLTPEQQVEQRLL